MRYFLLAPLLILIGSCANHRGIDPYRRPVPEAAPALAEGVPWLSWIRQLQILYDCQLGEPHRFTYTASDDKNAIPRAKKFSSRS